MSKSTFLKKSSNVVDKSTYHHMQYKENMNTTNHSISYSTDLKTDSRYSSPLSPTPKNMIGKSGSNRKSHHGTPNKENLRYGINITSPGKFRKTPIRCNISPQIATPKKYGNNNANNANSRHASINKSKQILTPMEYFALKPFTCPLQPIDEVNSVMAQSTDNYTPGKLSSNLTLLSLANRSQILNDITGSGNHENFTRISNDQLKQHNIELLIKAMGGGGTGQGFEGKDGQNNNILTTSIAYLNDYFDQLAINSTSYDSHLDKKDDIESPLVVLMQPIKEVQGFEELCAEEYLSTEATNHSPLLESQQMVNETNKNQHEIESNVIPPQISDIPNIENCSYKNSPFGDIAEIRSSKSKSKSSECGESRVEVNYVSDFESGETKIEASNTINNPEPFPESKTETTCVHEFESLPPKIQITYVDEPNEPNEPLAKGSSLTSRVEKKENLNENISYTENKKDTKMAHSMSIFNDNTLDPETSSIYSNNNATTNTNSNLTTANLRIFESHHKHHRSDYSIQKHNRINSLSGSKSFILRLPHLMNNNNNNLDSSRLTNLNDSIFSMKEYLIDLKDPAEEILKKLKEKRQYYYEDDIFLPNITALFNNTKKAKKNPVVQDIEWKRISQIYKHYNISICDYIDASIIKPGKFENHYLVSTFTALAEYPFYISRLFGNQEYNQEGCYSIRIFRDGSWKIILIDDIVPIIKQTFRPAFLGVNHVIENITIWPILLEKAWAKAFDNYENIQNGMIFDTLKEFTGAPSFSIGIMDEELWEKLIMACEMRYIMVADFGNKKCTAKASLGLDSNYSYPIIGIFIVNTSTGSERLIKIRNYWSADTYEGEWSAQSSQWTPNIIKEIQKYDIDIHERGTNWLSFKEFQNLFTSVIINKANEGYINSQIRLRQHKNTPSIAEFEVIQPTMGFLEVTQVDKMLFRTPCQYEYSRVRLLLFKKEGLEYTYVNGVVTDNQKSTTLEVELDIGHYAVLVIFDWKNEIYDFNLGYYGDIQIEWNRLRLKENPKLLTELWKNTLISQGIMKKLNNKAEYKMYSLELMDLKLKIDLLINDSKNGVLGLRRIINKIFDNKYGYYIPNHHNHSSNTIELAISSNMTQIIMLYQKDLTLPLKIDYTDS